ncbi:MAG: glutamate--tRNA ligase, partial [Lachnospiraceae bacterium]
IEMLKAYTQENGCKVNAVMWPLRIAVSGQSVTPAGATEIMDIIGKDESIARIRAAIEKLEA